MKFTRILIIALASILLAASLAMAASIAPPGPEDIRAAAFDGSTRALHIVQLAAPPLALYEGGLPGLAPTNPHTLGATSLDIDAPASRDYLDHLAGQQAAVVAQAEALIGRPLEVRFSYSFAFAGFAAEMSPAEAARVAALPDVRQVAPDARRQLHTDVGPGWIGAPGVWDGSATGSASRGEGVIIGVIDSGLNLDHPSFADPGPIDGFDYPNPFGAGVYKGLCATNPARYRCNDKLLGYYIFTGETTDDTDGHGSHTASTAGGNRVAALLDVSVTNPFSYTAAISGVAPHAHLIAYDACEDADGCPITALVAAIDQAVADGVDVINYSIGSASSNPWVDADAQAFLGAVAAGVIPAVSAGNSGPGPSTVGSPAEAPWVLTVAASTHTRSSEAALVNLSGGASTPPADMKGQALTAAYGPAPIVYAGKFGDPKCQTPFPANTWSHGEIVVCDRGGNARVAKGTAVKKGGARGMVLANTQPGESLVADAHIIPAIHLSKADGDALKTWLSTGSGHTATIQATQISFDPAHADAMAGFSSRGPNLNTARDVIKPDVTAPGVDILAAFRSGSGPAGDAEPWMDEFNFLSGTSMSSPHTAGAAALLHALHPTWTPPEVKSALMTTAVVAGVRKEDDATPADPFDMGGGRIDVGRAAHAGLVWDITPAQFYAADPAVGGDPKTLNLPSLADSACSDLCSWTRTVRNPTNRSLLFTASYAGAGHATVTPSFLNLGPGQTASFRFTLDVSAATKGAWAFGLLNWHEPGSHAPDAHLPVAVIPVTPVAQVGVYPSSLRADLAPGRTTTNTLTIANTGAATLNWQIKEDVSQPGGEAIVLDAAAPGEATTLAPAAVPVVLKVDDGSAEWNIGRPGGGQFLWLNRFTPAPATFPISLAKVQVLFELGGVEVGEKVDIYLYEDKDGDGNPGTGAVHRASLKNLAVQSTDGRTFSTFTFPAPVLLTGPGDVLIAVVNRTAGLGSGEGAATLDFSSIPRRRSWFGNYAAAPPDPPVLPPPSNWGLIDDLSFGKVGNWLIRGLGTGRGPCDVPADIPWLKNITPAGGSTAAGSSTAVQITLDATGLAAGDYQASLCIDSNDPQTPRLVVPVQLTVAADPAIQVIPASLHARLAPDKQTAQPLAIRNTGGQNLVWAVVETRPAAEAMAGAAPLAVLYDQTDHPGSNGFPSQFFPDFSGRLRGADDFVVPDEDGGWRVERLAAAGLYSAGDGPAPSFDVAIFANDGSLPGAEVYRALQVPPTSDQGGAIVLDLPQPAMLPPGRYWLAVMARMAFNPGSQQWFWLTRETQNGHPYAFENPNTLIPIPQCVSWQPGAAVCGVAGGIDPDALFRLEGTRGAPACSNAGDIGWLRLAPANGAAAPGASSTVQATFDSSGLTPGLYLRSLCISNNSPSTPFVIVPVQLEVTSPPPKVFLPLLAR